MATYDQSKLSAYRSAFSSTLAPDRVGTSDMYTDKYGQSWTSGSDGKAFESWMDAGKFDVTGGTGTVSAPTPDDAPTQNSWWNTPGNTGLIGSVSNAVGGGYTSTGANAASYNANNASAASYVGQGYDANTGTAQQYNATNWNVDPSQTVQGQVAGIIDGNSPLMRRAETRSNQAMNGRGLINSSMAVGAGQAALYDAALPMAQQDATTYGNSAQYNATAANTANQYNAGNRQAMELANTAAKNQAAEYGATATNASNAANAANTQQVNLANQNAANAAASQNAANTQQANLANAAATNAANEFTAAAGNQASLANAAASNALQQQSNTIRQQAAAGDLSAALDVAKMDLDQQFKASLANADAQTKAYLQEMEASSKVQLANIEADYKTLIQTSASASEIYKGTLSSITAIIADTNMDAASKTEAINGLFNRMGTAMNLVGSINGVNVSDLLDFGEAEATP